MIRGTETKSVMPSRPILFWPAFSQGLELVATTQIGESDAWISDWTADWIADWTADWIADWIGCDWL